MNDLIDDSSALHRNSDGMEVSRNDTMKKIQIYKVWLGKGTYGEKLDTQHDLVRIDLVLRFVELSYAKDHVPSD
jgi:hypothetical protein